MLIFTLSIIGCSQNSALPTDQDVFTWAQENLEIALSQTDQIKPGFFVAALMPDDLELKKKPEDFDGTQFKKKITDNNARFLRDVGIVSALADHCELKWNSRNFVPMMQWQRARLPQIETNQYLIYRIGVAHGYAMGTTDRILKHWKPDCERLKTDIEGRLFADVFP